MKRFEELSEYQKIVLSAYLGVLMCEPGDLILYLSDKFDRRVDSENLQTLISLVK